MTLGIVASHSAESLGLRHRPALSPGPRLAPPSAPQPGGRFSKPNHGLSAPSKKLDFVDFPTNLSAQRVRRSATAHHTLTAAGAGGAGSLSAASSRAARFTLPPTYIDLTNMYRERCGNFLKNLPHSSQGTSFFPGYRFGLFSQAPFCPFPCTDRPRRGVKRKLRVSALRIRSRLAPRSPPGSASGRGPGGPNATLMPSSSAANRPRNTRQASK